MEPIVGEGLVPSRGGESVRRDVGGHEAGDPNGREHP